MIYDMRKTIVAVIIALVVMLAGITTESARADSPVSTVIEKVKSPDDWLSRKSLKYGYIATACITNSIRMSLEADKFSGRGYGDDYHLKRTGEIAGYIALGYLTYAVLKRDTWTRSEKANLIAGTALLAQVSGETFYQGGMHGWRNCLNNNPKWHENELFWVQGKSGFPGIKDDMIGTNEWSTPAYKTTFVGIGMNRIGKVH